MAELRFISGRAAMGKFLEGLAEDMRGKLSSGGFDASGRLSRSIRSQVNGGPIVSGFIEALDYWRYVGNGRGPGKMPPVPPLISWPKSNGLAATDAQAQAIGWAVARNIAKEGSLDHQLKGRNQFDLAIEEAQERIDDLLGEFLAEVDDAVLAQFNNSFRAVA